MCADASGSPVPQSLYNFFFFFKVMLYIEHFTLRKLPSGMKSSWSITSKIQIGPKVITAQTPNVLLTCSTQLFQSRLLVDTLTDSQKANNQLFFFFISILTQQSLKYPHFSSFLSPASSPGHWKVPLNHPAQTLTRPPGPDLYAGHQCNATFA